MPARISMTKMQREKLLALPDAEDEVVRYHSLTADDLAAIAQSRMPETRLGYALQLCCLRYPGRYLRRGELCRAKCDHIKSTKHTLLASKETSFGPRLNIVILKDSHQAGYNLGSAGPLRHLGARFVRTMHDNRELPSEATLAAFALLHPDAGVSVNVGRSIPPDKLAAQAGRGYATCLWLSGDRNPDMVARWT